MHEDGKAATQVDEWREGSISETRSWSEWQRPGSCLTVREGERPMGRVVSREGALPRGALHEQGEPG